MTYRIYFMNQNGFIIGRDDYIADDDEHAMAIARTLKRACSDICSGIEVWHGIRRVDAAPIRAASGQSVDEIVAQIQNTVIERLLALRDSRWVIAESVRLIQETQRLLDRQRPPSLHSD